MHRTAKKSRCAGLAPPEQSQGISSCSCRSILARERYNIAKRTQKGNTVKAHNESMAGPREGRRELEVTTCRHLCLQPGFYLCEFLPFQTPHFACLEAGMMCPHRPVPASQAGRSWCSVSSKCLFSSSSFPDQQDLPRELLLRPQIHRIP